MARRLRTRYDETLAEALWRDACGSAVAWRMLQRCAAIPAEALWRDACQTRSGATPAEAL